RSFWKAPETFQRERSRQNFWPIAITVAQIATAACLVVWSLSVLIVNIRKGLVRWRPAMLIGGAAAALLMLSELLARNQMLQIYPTAVPFQTFESMQYVLVATSAIFGFILLTGAVALLISSFPESLTAWRISNRRVMGIDAAAALIAAVGFAILVNRFEGFLMDRFHKEALFSLSSPNLIVTAVPALAALAGSFRTALVFVAAAGAIALFVRRWRLWTIPLAFL